MHGGVYKRRTPEKSDLYRITYQHFEEYEKVYPERYEEEYGYFRKIITATICKYLDCGIMEKHPALWPIAYPGPAAIEARASPFDFKPCCAG